MTHIRKHSLHLITLWVALLATSLALLTVVTVSAQQSIPTPSDDQVNQVAREMYCPVCENTPLDVCPTQACAQWRDLIREKLSQGWTGEQIKNYFVEQFGDRVLATPPARGFNWLVYLIPPIALLGGAFLLYQAFRTWKQPLPTESTATEAITDEYIARLEEELKRSDR